MIARPATPAERAPPSRAARLAGRCILRPPGSLLLGGQRPKFRRNRQPRLIQARITLHLRCARMFPASRRSRPTRRRSAGSPAFPPEAGMPPMLSLVKPVRHHASELPPSFQTTSVNGAHPQANAKAPHLGIYAMSSCRRIPLDMLQRISKCKPPSLCPCPCVIFLRPSCGPIASRRAEPSLSTA